MGWFTAARRLRQLGVLGMNRRNGACILGHNPRTDVAAVDDKLRFQQLCAAASIPTPAVYAVIERTAQLRHLSAILDGRDDFAIKPNRGSGGRGIVVVAGRDGAAFRRTDGEVLRPDDLRRHLGDLLAGMYSLGGRPDVALVQQRVRFHPAFEAVAEQGIPDTRVIVYRGVPAMAMLRLPTRSSGGRANLHQGGVGVGIDIETGRTVHAVHRGRPATVHPDTGAPLIGRAVPNWQAILAMAGLAAATAGLGYLGVDVVHDCDRGPLLLEANARPGLTIQVANAAGLRHRLDAIDARLRAQPLRPAAPAAA